MITEHALLLLFGLIAGAAVLDAFLRLGKHWKLSRKRSKGEVLLVLNAQITMDVPMNPGITNRAFGRIWTEELAFWIEPYLLIILFALPVILVDMANHGKTQLTEVLQSTTSCSASLLIILLIVMCFAYANYNNWENSKSEVVESIQPPLGDNGSKYHSVLTHKWLLGPLFPVVDTYCLWFVFLFVLSFPIMILTCDSLRSGGHLDVLETASNSLFAFSSLTLSIVVLMALLAVHEASQSVCCASARACSACTMLGALAAVPVSCLIGDGLCFSDHVAFRRWSFTLLIVSILIYFWGFFVAKKISDDFLEGNHLVSASNRRHARLIAAGSLLAAAAALGLPRLPESILLQPVLRNFISGLRIECHNLLVWTVEVSLIAAASILLRSWTYDLEGTIAKKAIRIMINSVRMVFSRMAAAKEPFSDGTVRVVRSIIRALHAILGIVGFLLIAVFIILDWEEFVEKVIRMIEGAFERMSSWIVAVGKVLYDRAVQTIKSAERVLHIAAPARTPSRSRTMLWMKGFLREFVPALIPAFLLSSLLAFVSCSSQPETYKVGYIAPFTGDGAHYGETVKSGADLAVEDINAAGGINGKKMQLLYEDDQLQPNLGLNALNKLIDKDKCPIIIGAFSSGVTLAIAPVAEKRQVVLLSPTATNDKIKDAGDYIFRVCPSDAVQGAVHARLAHDRLKAKRVAILFENSGYGFGLYQMFKQTFQSLGGTIVAEEGFEEGATDLRTQLTKIRQANPDLVFLPSHYPTGAQALRQAKELNIKVTFMV